MTRRSPPTRYVAVWSRYVCHSIGLIQGGYHELANEPDGMDQKFTDDVIAWILTHLPAATSEVQTKL